MNRESDPEPTDPEGIDAMRIFTQDQGLRDAPEGADLPDDPTTAYDGDGHALSWSTDNGRTVLVSGPYEPPLFRDIDLDPGNCLVLANTGEVYVAAYADLDLCSECGASLADGEGYDGLCGTHADQADARGEWA